MRKPFAALTAVWCLFAAWPAGIAAAQAPGEAPLSQAVRRAASLQELVLRDGSRLYGRVERDGESEIVFRTEAGAVMTVARADILSLRHVQGTIVDGEFQRADPNATRLFFGPTGRSIPKGRVYVGIYEFLMPFVQVGVTDRLSIGGGTPLVFGIDEWERPFWVTPKLQVHRGQRTQLSVGVFHAFDSDGDGGGIAYGVGTFGRDDASLTVGAGLAYSGADDRAGVLMVGGERQVSRSIKFVTENYVWKGGEGVASGGIRFFGEHLSADLALGIPLGVDQFFVFPVVNFVYLF